MIAKDLINDSFPPLKLSDSGLKAINWMEEFRLEHLPLVDSVNYIGLASEEDILKHYSESGIFEDANGVLVLEVGAKSYSLSEIAHIIESEDGKIISSYITPNPENETIDITIKINQRELSRILASFSRHGYFVKEHYHQNEFMDDIKSRYDSLMNYLGI